MSCDNSDETPLKYQKMRADHIMEAAKKAERAMLSKASRKAKRAIADSETESEEEHEPRKSLNVCEKDMDSKLSPEEEKMQAAGNSKDTVSSKKAKKQTKATTSKAAKKKKQDKMEDYDIDGGDSVEETDDGMDENEDPSLLDDDVESIDVEGKDITHFDESLWKMNELPEKQQLPFIGRIGPQHALPVATATPFEYFCLFIPIFYWDRWALFTNQKADMERNKTPGKGRKWRDTSGAE